MAIKYQRIAVNASSSGQNTLVAAVTGKRIKILAGELIPAGTVNLKFRDGASTELSNAIPLTAGANISLPLMEDGGALPLPHFITTAGNAFTINLDAAVAITGWLIYDSTL